MGTIPASENEFPQLLFAEVAAPSTPASGLVVCYAKSDGLIYCKDDAGTETAMGALPAHLADTSDAHDASAISVLDTGAFFTGTDVEAVLAELYAAIAAAGIPPTIVDVKGDIIAATAADTVARLASGANGSRLEAQSGQTTGLQWHALTTVDGILGGDVTMVNATTFYDGPSGSFGAGTWLVMAQTMIKVTATTSQTYGWLGKLWDGTTVYSEAFEGARTAANYTNWAFHLNTMCAIITLGSTTTLKVSVECNRGSSASAIARTETGLFANGYNLGSRITGYRLAL